MQLAKIESPNQLTDIIQSLVTGSFEKKFKGLRTADVVDAFAFATKELNQSQLQMGIETILDRGYCPDPALFRQWCLGNKDFKNDDEIANSYIDKHGALSRLLKWLDDKKQPISIEIKQAYDNSYHMFTCIHSEQDKSRAELAFKGEYVFIVNQRIKNKIASEIYTPPIAIDCKKVKQVHTPADKQTAMLFLGEIKQKLAKKTLYK